MKKTIIILLALLVALPTSVLAQNLDKVPHSRRMHNMTNNLVRTEIVTPQVNGYNIYKADLHIHTIFSDGDVTPSLRVSEAWYDGLDIIAITDHLEARTYERKMLKALAGYNADGKPHRYSHAGAVKKKPDNTGINSNLNRAFNHAASRAKKAYPELLVIKGTEIGREPTQMGHFNALFLTDIQGVYDKDIKESFRKVKAQGGLLIHNHPVYRRKTTDKSEWQEGIYAEKWFDGVEIVNGATFYPKMIRRCIEENLFMVAATDAHRPTHAKYRRLGIFRTHTLIFAKENTQEAIKEALMERRTLGYCGDNIMGKEELLKDLFNASVECKCVGYANGKKSRIFVITNNSSYPYSLKKGGSAMVLEPFKSVRITIGKDKEGQWIEPTYYVMNMWHMDDKHPLIKLQYTMPEENK